MKANASSIIAVLCGLPAILAAGPASASSVLPAFSIKPGQVSYTYVSPAVSVSAIAQVGNNKSATVVQDSAINISGVSQVGNNVKTTVVQAGVVNSSAISQTGHHSTALVVQFGSAPSLLGP